MINKIMKKLTLLIAFCSLVTQAQIKNKIEGIIINAPCEIEYVRNINGQNNYTCNYTKGNILINYTVHISNLYKDINGLNEKNLKTYKRTFLKTVKENAEKVKEKTKYILLLNNKKALAIEAFMSYSDLKFKNTSVVFIHRKKSFIVNIVSNDFKKSNIEKVMKAIEF